MRRSFKSVNYRGLTVAAGLTILTFFQPGFSALPNQQIEPLCDKLAALSKAFAEARDNKLGFTEAEDRISKSLSQNNQQVRRTIQPILQITGGLAYSQKTLQPISLFAVSKFFCMSYIRNPNNKAEALKYLIESSKVCQKRLKTKIYACMDLAYTLYIQDKNKKNSKN